MYSLKIQLFKDLFEKFLALNSEVEAIIVSDREGFIIAGEKKRDIDLEIVSFLTAVVSPIIERIRHEFSFKKFGTASFDTEDHRLLFISIDEEKTLSLVVEILGSLERLSPYAYFLAEKTAQILTSSEGDSIQLDIPNFEYEAKLSKITDRLKNQIYQSKLDHGGEYLFKFIVIGEHEVGKTSLIRRFVEKKFYGDYRTTIGLNIMTHKFEVFGNEVTATLWDLGAQKYFKRFRKTYYNGAQAVFIVFDLTNKESFDSVTKWHNELMQFMENRDLPIVIIGNKSDLIEQRQISFEEGKKLASGLSELSEYHSSSDLSDFSDLSKVYEKVNTKVSYIETSALTGDNVDDAFTLISYHFMMINKEMEGERLNEKILNEIYLILKEVEKLSLTFITEDHYWSPGLQILTEMDGLEEPTEIKEKKNERLFKYSNGLILKNFTHESFKVSDSDGVFCIFDAREKEHIDPTWEGIIINILEKIKKNKVVLIGIRVSENIDWSQLMKEFDVSMLAEEKMVSLLFFKVGEEYRLEIYNQLETMLSTIKNLIYSY